MWPQKWKLLQLKLKFTGKSHQITTVEIGTTIDNRIRSSIIYGTTVW